MNISSYPNPHDLMSLLKDKYDQYLSQDGKMAQKTLDIGTTANSRTGDPLRDAMIKVNDNFTELYSSIGAITTETPLSIKTKYESNDDTNCFTDELKAKLDGIEDGATTDMTGDEIVVAINTKLGGTEWQGGGILTGPAIVNAINLELGGTEWQEGGVLDGDMIVNAINETLGGTSWQLGGGTGGSMTGSEIVNAINEELETPIWQQGSGGLSVSHIATQSYTVTNNDLSGGKGVALSTTSEIIIPAGLTNSQPFLVINMSSDQIRFSTHDNDVSILTADGRMALRTQFSSATIIPLGDNAYVIVGDIDNSTMEIPS